MSSAGWGCGPHKAPPVAGSEEVKVGAQPLAVGVFGSHGGSAGRRVLLPVSVSTPGSGTRYDARVKPGVSKECESLLPMWRDALRPLSLDAVNGDTEVYAAPPCELGHAFGDVRILYLRQRHGVVARVMLCRIDVQAAFRQIPGAPLHARFGYVFDEYAVVNLFLQFGWRTSPGYWDLILVVGACPQPDEFPRCDGFLIRQKRCSACQC